MRRRRARAAGAIVNAWIPYCGPAPSPGEWRWNLDPWLLILLGLAVVLTLWRAEPGRRGCGLAAIAVAVIVFVSPLCALSSALFAARTVHHVLLVAVMAPLIAWATPRRPAGPLAISTASAAVVLWFWHAPDAYSAALSHDAIYWMMQFSLLASAVWFWMGVRRATAPAAVAGLLAMMLAMGLLGALLTFGERALYAPHALSTVSWGLTPLEDQQAAGLIMWAPAAGVYLLAALVLLGRWLGPDSARGVAA